MTLTLPTIDLAAPDAAAALAGAFERIGFAQLTGHGLSPDARRELRSTCDAFFATAHSEKLRFVHPDPAANRGYRAKGAEALSYSLGEPTPPDLFESFNCGDDARASSSPLLQPTPWPDALAPGFRAAADAMRAEFEALSADLDALIETALGQQGLLCGRSDRGPDMMACINYEPGPDGSEPAEPGQQRMGAHSDYTTFTLLDADPVPGLQIVGPEGAWVDVVPDRDALLINIGDVLAMFTNDQWKSTLHRVVPISAGSAPRRRSVAYFHYPDLDVEVSPLARFVESRAPARYAPVTVEAHLLGKLTAPKVHEPATSASTAAGRPVA